MKIIRYVCLLTIITGLLFSSCESTYLDKMIESDGFTDEDVFGDSVNYHAFVDNLILIPNTVCTLGNV